MYLKGQENTFPVLKYMNVRRIDVYCSHLSLCRSFSVFYSATQNIHMQQRKWNTLLCIHAMYFTALSGMRLFLASLMWIAWTCWGDSSGEMRQVWEQVRNPRLAHLHTYCTIQCLYVRNEDFWMVYDPIESVKFCTKLKLCFSFN